MNKVIWLVCLIIDVALIPIKIPILMLYNIGTMIYCRICCCDTWKETFEVMLAIRSGVWEKVIGEYKDVWNGNFD
jgi:hypothetical protein